MVAGKKTKNVIAKTKTFGGCWTCRGRKVKCDTRRPRCLRCEKAKLECAGYDIKLFWVGESDDMNVSSIKRQAMSLIAKSPWSLREDEVEQYLAEIDIIDNRLGSKPIFVGPFGVFRSQNNSPDSEFKFDFVPLKIDSTNDVAISYDSFSDVSSTEVLFSEADESAVFDDTTFTGRSVLDQVNWDTATNLARGAERDFSLTVLMQNYVHNVTTVLQPFHNLENTYKSIYVPIALAVSEKFLLDSGHLSSDISMPQLAIFYSILSTSAFHLRGPKGLDALHSIGINLRAKALAYLRRGLDLIPEQRTQLVESNTSTKRVQLQAILSAMLTLVTADVMDGQMAEFWIHLDGARQVLKQLHQRVGPQSNIHSSVTILRFLTVITDTTSTSLTPLPWHGTSDLDVGDDGIPAAGHGLEYTYGVTPTLANFIHYTTLLSRHISFYLTNHKALPSSLLSTCEQLQSRLESWSIAMEDLSTIANDEPITLLLAEEHMLAFAQSIRIYFHTRVLPCDPSELKTRVRSVASHLTNIELIKKDTGYNTTMTASVSWPGFIASCEAEPEDREQWRDWWQTMIEYRIGNINTLWSIVQEAWLMRDNGLRETPAWLPVLRRDGRRILAI